MTDPIPTLLSRLKALHAKATPGPWTAHNFQNCEFISKEMWRLDADRTLNTDFYPCSDGFVFGETEFNVKLIAELRNAWPALLAHIEAQDKRLSVVSGLVEALEKIAAEKTNYRDGHICARGTVIQSVVDIARAALAAWRKNHG